MSERSQRTTRLLLSSASERAMRYVDEVSERRVAPTLEAVSALSRFHEPFPEKSCDPELVLALLDEFGSPATVASTGGRCFGFVIGGSLPAVTASSWLASAWDQNAALRVMSPVAAELEEVVLRWISEVFGLAPEVEGGLVTCATMANFSALLAARSAILKRADWNVEDDGLFGAPEISVVVGEEVHASLEKALSLCGLGRKRVTRVPVDGQGRMRADKLPALNERTIVCMQAGNVNTGAFDPAQEICEAAKLAGAWVHVDGAFGLWVAASPKYRDLTRGFELADSWATDAHKWPNVSYDCGIVLVREGLALRQAMTMSAAYLQAGLNREPANHVPEASRRARGVELWAGLKSVGRAGLRELVERTCEHARSFAAGLEEAGYQVLNEVVINQVLVAFGDEAITQRVIERVQKDGTCWCGGTVWQGKPAMRISVSSWMTTNEDVERSLAAILRIARSSNE